MPHERRQGYERGNRLVLLESLLPLKEALLNDKLFVFNKGVLLPEVRSATLFEDCIHLTDESSVKVGCVSLRTAVHAFWKYVCVVPLLLLPGLWLPGSHDVDSRVP